ncbi:MAG TPA: ABC transporter substrate-binding protein [Anaerolineae bacterium]|nr:ABC transporter substrate-binding protein [Anaerolineae bacterium]HID85047.1 ABC transporter substrate-binding protein [Anaerolineales bacterium]HIQ08846.1 ABC transporter substrate-binding protein [Anaerolineaceae bacterium]
MSKKVLALLGVLVVLSMLLAACQPKEVVVTKEVIVTQEVEKVVTQEVVVTKEVPVEKTAGKCAPTTFEELGDSPIKIGVPVPMSAPGSVGGGRAMITAVQIAANQVNAKGGIMGKYKVKPVFYDTSGLPERGTAAMEYLITSECVVGVAGEYHSSAGVAEKEVAHKYHVPAIFAETWNDKITGVQYPEVFRIAPASSMVAKGDAQFFKDMGVSWVAIVTENTDYGIPASESTQKKLADLGIQSDIYKADQGTQDFSTLVTRVQQDLSQHDGKKAVLVLITGETSYNFEQQAVEGGLAPAEDLIFVANQVAANAKDFWQNVPDGNYMVFRWVGGGSPFAMARRAEAQDFIQAYKDAWKDPQHFPERYAFEAYDAFMLLVKAIEEAGSLDADAIIAALEAHNSPENGVALAQGVYYFPYGTQNPVPSDQPEWMWHQWPDPKVFFLQYWKSGQPLEEACAIWPADQQTCGTDYVVPGTEPNLNK